MENYKYDIGTYIKKNKPEHLKDSDLADVLKNTWKPDKTKLKTIIETIELCGHQGLALRGGQDSGELSLKTPVKNDGNFRSLLRYRIQSGDNLFLNHIQNCSKNASYISADVQNEVISIISEYIQHKICDKINEGKYFTILADETTDISRIEQFSLCIRYLEKKF